MFVLPVSQANAGLFDRLKERLQPTVQEEPVVQEVNMDQYSDQAAVLTSTLMKLAPLMKGKSQTGQLSRDLKLDPSSLGLEMGENGIKVGEGLEVSLGGISMDPIGVKLTMYMDSMRVLKATDYTTDVYSTGSMDMVIGYDIIKQKIVVKMDSGDHGVTEYTGGSLEGTTFEFEDVSVSISTKKFLMPWEEQFSVGGTIYVNGMAIPVEEMKDLLEMLMKG